MFMKLYSVLNRPKIRRKMNRIEKTMQRRLPWLHEHFVLSLKAGLKKRAFFSQKRIYLHEQELTWEIEKDEQYEPLISVIVPNFNHEPYLEERLASIYGQTYKHIEVILLDDCSTDNSVAILQKYQERFPEITSLHVNRQNGKKVFDQWKKGLALANGELVWIAESDDYCTDNFLAELVGAFANQAVMLAFCQSSFRQKGVEIDFTAHYLEEIVDFNWNRSFAVTAHDLVQRAFALKNIIPNVSSALFRNGRAFDATLENLWDKMGLCGDWAFYLAQIKGGLVYYNAVATNYYRIHENSTSLRIQKTSQYYVEHLWIAEYIVTHYAVPFSCFERQKEKLLSHYLYFHGDGEPKKMDEWYCLEKIAEQRKKKLPSILMCGFSMSVGGGESFPIFLANELKRQGLVVTYIDFELAEHEDKVRDLLDPSIPLIGLKDKNLLGKILVRWGGDIIHSHHASVDEIITHFIDSSDMCQHVVTLHGMYETLSKHDLKRVLFAVNNSCSCFVYTAEKNLTSFRESGYFEPSKMVKVDNGLPEFAIDPVKRADLGIAEEAFVLCLVSRAIPEKGWREACAAVALARKISGQDIHLLLIGLGEMYDCLQKHKEEFVHLLGFKSNIRDYFALADMGFLPSRFPGESFPLVIIDCLFCGKPVVASSIGEIPYQLLDEEGGCAGALFDLENGEIPVEKLADIIALFAQKGDAYREACLAVPARAKQFSIQETAKHYREIYENVKQNLM